jgi:hypothetical protein
MDNVARRNIFDAQVKNVRILETARTQVRRAINDALRTSNDRMPTVQTKLLGLLFCAWAVANFHKMVHIPAGFTLDEIRQIRTIWDAKGITEGWKKCVELGLRRARGDAGFKSNARLRLMSIVDSCVGKPSQLRNRIAHGQWRQALNNKCTEININITMELDQLDVVKIEIWFECHRRLPTIVENLIASPTRTFIYNYTVHTVKLDEFIKKSQELSVSEKRRRLQDKHRKFRDRQALHSQPSNSPISESEEPT